MYNLPTINNTTNKIASDNFPVMEHNYAKVEYMSRTPSTSMSYNSYSPIAKFDYYKISANTVTESRQEFRYQSFSGTDVVGLTNTYVCSEIPFADTINITYGNDVKISGHVNNVNVQYATCQDFTIPSCKNLSIIESSFNTVHFPKINSICNIDSLCTPFGTFKNVTGNFSNYVFKNAGWLFYKSNIVDASDMNVSADFITFAFADSTLKYPPKNMKNVKFAAGAFCNCPLDPNTEILQNVPYMDHAYYGTPLQGNIVMNGYPGGQYSIGSTCDSTFYNTQISNAELRNVYMLNETFYNCTNLETAKIVDLKIDQQYFNMTTNKTFYNCTNLTDVHISEIYGYETFYNCTNLTNVTADNNIMTIKANRMISNHTIFSNISNIQSLPNITISKYGSMDGGTYSSRIFYKCNISTLNIVGYDCNINIMRNCNVDNLYISSPEDTIYEFDIGSCNINNANIDFLFGSISGNVNNMYVKNTSYTSLRANINNLYIDDCNGSISFSGNVSNCHINTMNAYIPYSYLSTGVSINNMHIDNLYSAISPEANNVRINTISTNRPSFMHSKIKKLSWNSMMENSNLESSFMGCYELTQISDISSVTNTFLTFGHCHNLRSVNIDSGNLDMYAFYECKNISNVSIGDIPASNCTLIDGFFGTTDSNSVIGVPLNTNYYAKTNVTFRLTGNTVTADIIDGFKSFIDCGGTLTIRYKNGTDFANNVGNSYLANSQNVTLVTI